MDCKMVIFDLDGVLVDSAKYHFIAWRALAQKLGFDLRPEQDEQMKGVSRNRALEIMLEMGGLADAFTTEQKEAMATEKNEQYLSYIEKLTQGDLLPGAEALLRYLRTGGVKIGLGSASKNAGILLDRLGIADAFDVIIDGNVVRNAKPDPEVFLKGAAALGIAPAQCIVFEDAQAGIDAALAAGMTPIGVGSPQNLQGAVLYVRDLSDARIHDVIAGEK